jgi:hypothetical protein
MLKRVLYGLSPISELTPTCEISRTSWDVIFVATISVTAAKGRSAPARHPPSEASRRRAWRKPPSQACTLLTLSPRSFISIGVGGEGSLPMFNGVLVLSSAAVLRGLGLGFSNRLNYTTRQVPLSGVSLGTEFQIYCGEWGRCGQVLLDAPKIPCAAREGCG